MLARRASGWCSSRSLRVAVALGATVAIAGCGSASAPSPVTSSTAGGPPTSSTSSASAAPAPAPAVAQLGAAEHPAAGEFPAPHGRTLQQLAKLARTSVNLGAATGTFTPGTQRYAFALIAGGGAYVYAPTAVYLATSPGAPARGPYLAPADPMTVPAQDRSEQNSGPGGIAAIYAARVPLARAGTYTTLSLTHTPSGLVGAPGEIAVAASSPIPGPGQRAPDIATDTAATVHGNAALLTTRLPPEHMAAVSLAQVLGRRPVALLFSTPQLCISRVCGPVTDVTVDLQHAFGGRIAFIHEEVYVDNQPSKGLRPQLTAFGLRTEPWLFAIDRHGVIVARLEGAFGTTELRRALQAALR